MERGRSPHHWRRNTALLLVAFVVAGCGYRFSSDLPARYATIYVPTFKNESHRYGLQVPLTNAVRRMLANDGRLRLVSDEEEADLVLEGAIVDTRLAPRTFTPRDRVQQFELAVAARVRLIDKRGDRVLWEDLLTGKSVYFRRNERPVQPTRATTRRYVGEIAAWPTLQENEGGAEALEDLASRIFYRVVENW